MSVLYGPVKLIWGWSRVADSKVVVEKLQSKLPKGTQFFGVQGRCHAVGEVYTCYMVLWPQLLAEEQSTAQKQIQQWRDRLHEVVAELDTLNLETHSKDSEESTEGEKRIPAKRVQDPYQGRWIVDSVREGVGATQFVRVCIQEMQLHRAFLERDIVLFGEIAFEYETHGQKWQEMHSGAAEGSYVWSVKKTAQ